MKPLKFKSLFTLLPLALLISGCGGDNYTYKNSSTNFDESATTIVEVSSCDELNNSVVFQKGVFCQSAYAYYTKLQSALQSFAGQNSVVEGNFTYYYHIPSSQTLYAGIDYDQTWLECNDTRLMQIDLDANEKNLYPDNYPNDHFRNGLGNTLCQFIAYIGSVAENTSWSYTKTPIDYFDKILSMPTEFGKLDANKTSIFDGLVRNLSSNAAYYYETLGGQMGSMFTPDEGNITFTNDYYKSHQESPYSAYWGFSAGGGSGAGFQIYIGEKAESSNVVFSGGFGGGGGFTSPEFDVNTIGELINIAQVAIGSGGGGGLQFASPTGYETEFTNGLGLGAGAGAYEQFPEYSYYPDNSTSPYKSYNQTVINQFSSQLDAMKRLFSSNTITVKGGGGTGVGAEYLYLDNTQEEPQLQEYLPHVISTGGGFTFSFQLQPTSATRVRESKNAITLDDTNFYKNMGNYYKEATNEASKNTKGKGGYACATYICKFTQQYVLKKAVEAYGSLSSVPQWLKLDHCPFNIGPSTCPAASTK